MTTLLTTAQAAAVLQISPATLRSWAAQGRIATVRHGREYRFEPEALTVVKETTPCRSTAVKVRRFGGRSGWASLQMVDRYMHLAPSHLASFANNI